MGDGTRYRSEPLPPDCPSEEQLRATDIEEWWDRPPRKSWFARLCEWLENWRSV